MGRLSDWCVYTRVASARLAAAEGAGAFEQAEYKPWVSVFREWPREAKAGRDVPVLLSAAEGANDVRWWGVLTNARRRGGGTVYTLDRVRRLPRPIRLSQLKKMDGSRVSPDFIRPYALCRTPALLHAIRDGKLSNSPKKLRHDRELFELLARSVEYAHRLAPDSWVVTFANDQLRLNVGQIAVLTIRRETVQMYVAARLARQFARQVVLGRTRSVYAPGAVDENVQILELTPSQVVRPPARLIDAHRAVLRAAVQVKRRSPWRVHLSEEWLQHIERVVGRRLPRPTGGAARPHGFRGGYWVVKGRPDENDFEAMLVEGGRGRWRTAAPPADWAPGDRLFFWESSPRRQIVGLGEILDVPRRRAHGRGNVFVGVRYLTGRLSFPISQEQLRARPELGSASFLKAGPAGTFHPLTAAEGDVVHRMVLAANPEIEDPWASQAAELGDEPSPSHFGAGREGDRRLVRHYRLERDRQLVAAKKTAYCRQHGHLACEICGFDFGQVYGPIARDFCEVHHLKPLATARGLQSTTLEDLAVVCANCHRTIHLDNPPVRPEQLRQMVVLARGGVQAASS
jgi:hypothetical protein